MHRRLTMVRMLGLAAICCLLGALSFSVGENVAPAEWLTMMSEAERLCSRGELALALTLYEKAELLAGSAELKADAAIRTTWTLEALRQRPQSIAACQSILRDYPQTGHAARIRFRLGELYTSISLLSEDATEAEVDRLQRTEMLPEKGIPYFERAVVAGPPLSSWVLASKLYLARLYMDTGRQAEAWSILQELATLKVEEVNTADYVGPYAELSTQKTAEERVAEARAFAAKVVRSAQTRLVSWSVVPGDPVQSLQHLQALMERYPGTELEALARKEAATVQERLAQELQSAAAREGASVIKSTSVDVKGE